jgi:hypothetical protein
MPARETARPYPLTSPLQGSTTDYVELEELFFAPPPLVRVSA